MPFVGKLWFNKYKTFSVLNIFRVYINTSGNWENEKLKPEGRRVFPQFRVFPISTSVDITVYQYGKNVLYLFYNIAQRNIKKFSDVSVLILSYINTALSQSAFTIYKCYIIICYIVSKYDKENLYLSFHTS
jgi:hypothetical protein